MTARDAGDTVYPRCVQGWARPYPCALGCCAATGQPCCAMPCHAMPRAASAPSPAQLPALPVHRHLRLLRRRRPGAHPTAATRDHLPLRPLQPHRHHPGQRFHGAEYVGAREGPGFALGHRGDKQFCVDPCSSPPSSLAREAEANRPEQQFHLPGRRGRLPPAAQPAGAHPAREQADGAARAAPQHRPAGRPSQQHPQHWPPARRFPGGCWGCRLVLAKT